MSHSFAALDSSANTEPDTGTPATTPAARVALTGAPFPLKPCTLLLNQRPSCQWPGEWLLITTSGWNTCCLTQHRKNSCWPCSMHARGNSDRPQLLGCMPRAQAIEQQHKVHKTDAKVSPEVPDKQPSVLRFPTSSPAQPVQAAHTMPCQPWVLRQLRQQRPLALILRTFQAFALLLPPHRGTNPKPRNNPRAC